jgi:hypothetical protein
MVNTLSIGRELDPRRSRQLEGEGAATAITVSFRKLNEFLPAMYRSIQFNLPHEVGPTPRHSRRFTANEGIKLVRPSQRRSNSWM